MTTGCTNSASSARQFTDARYTDQRKLSPEARVTLPAASSKGFLLYALQVGIVYTGVSFPLYHILHIHAGWLVVCCA